MRTARASLSRLRRPRGVRVALVVAFALGTAGLAACGEDDEETAKAQTLSLSVNPQGQLTGVKELSGGPVTVQFQNGGRLPYDLSIIRVDGGQSAADVLKVIDREGGPIPGWMHGSGGVASAAPGQASSSTQVLGPGTYHLIAQAESEGEAQGPKPTTATLKIAGGKAEGNLPTTSAKITAVDYRFTTSGLKAGRNTVEFQNSGRELHHAIVMPIAPGKTLADVRKFLQTEGPPQGQPPVEFRKATGTAVMDGGARQTTQLNLQKGRKVMLCFIQDRAGGPPHVAKGMVNEVNIP